MKKNSKTRIGGGGHRSLSQLASGFTPILGFRKSDTLKKKFKAFTLAEVLIPKRVSEIKNKVFNFRESKIKEPFNLNKKLVAFTLAEVLIPKRVSEIKNKVFNFRESKIKEPSRNTKKLCAFTLAEVLIPKRASGIDNKVKYSRASEIKEPLRNTKKLCAFTLAEVLITLAIIGVVAALTIPTVVAKYQKAQYYTQFMKMYNVLSEAYSMASNEYGPMESYSYKDRLDYFYQNVVPYLKVQKICKNEAECDITNDIKWNNLNANPHYDEYYHTYKDNSYSNLFRECDENAEECKIIVLTDGSFILGPNLGAGMIQMSVDTNGIKGPNTWGRDIFGLVIRQKDGGGPYRVMPSSIYSYTTLDDLKEDCTMEHESDGGSCSGRLLLEGKMNY